MSITDKFFPARKTSKPNGLTAIERSELANLESIVDRHVSTWPEIGRALAQIRDRQLYRETNSTWDEYLKAKWDIERRHADRLIQAAQVAQNLGPMGPQTERQARPLTSLPAAEQPAAWSEAYETAPKDKDGKPVITGEHVQAIVDRRKGRTTKKPPKPIRIRVPGAIVIIQPNRNGVDPLAALDSARGKLSQADAA